MNNSETNKSVKITKSGKFVVLTGLALFGILGSTGIIFYSHSLNSGSAQEATSNTESSVLGTFAYNPNDYYSIFLNNGSVYFGKIESQDQFQVRIADAHFLQVGTLAEDATADSQIPDLTVVAREQTLHSPDGEMYINMQNVLYIERLKPDSQVIEAMNALKAKQ